MWDCLPDDVLTEKILLRLPIKSILQCRCVCKSWYSLITTPSFISTHLRNKTENSAIFLQHFDEEIARFLFLFDNQDCFRPFSLHVPHGSPWSDIIGSINGLICISISIGLIDGNDIVKFIVFNPSIGHFLSIPPPFPPKKDSFCGWDVRGIGFDETAQDYKMLYFVSRVCFIYSLNSNSWRRLSTPRFPKSSIVYKDTTVFVNGRIYWLADRQPGNYCSNFMMVFDVKDETFCEIALPECLANSNNIQSMTEFGESSIAIIERNRYVANIWVTKEYGSLESWILLATLDSEEVDSKVLGLRNQEELMFRFPDRSRSRVRKITSLNINTMEMKNLMDMGECSPELPFSNVYKYVPSLVLLDKQNNVDAAFNVDVDFTPLAKDGLRRSKRARISPTRGVGTGSTMCSIA